MNQQVHVRQLSQPSVTRARGAEASVSLARLLDNGPIELELDGVDLLSASFLDEIVRLLAKRSQIEKVTFVTDDILTLDKLKRISAVRNARIYARGTHDAQRIMLAPRQVASGDSTFSASKVPTSWK